MIRVGLVGRSASRPARGRKDRRFAIGSIELDSRSMAWGRREPDIRGSIVRSVYRLRERRWSRARAGSGAAVFLSRSRTSPRRPLRGRHANGVRGVHAIPNRHRAAGSFGHVASAYPRDGGRRCSGRDGAIEVAWTSACMTRELEPCRTSVPRTGRRREDIREDRRREWSEMTQSYGREGPAVREDVERNSTMEVWRGRRGPMQELIMPGEPDSGIVPAMTYSNLARTWTADAPDVAAFAPRPAQTMDVITKAVRLIRGRGGIGYTPYGDSVPDTSRPRGLARGSFCCVRSRPLAAAARRVIPAELFATCALTDTPSAPAHAGRLTTRRHGVFLEGKWVRHPGFDRGLRRFGGRPRVDGREESLFSRRRRGPEPQDITHRGLRDAGRRDLGPSIAAPHG